MRIRIIMTSGTSHEFDSDQKPDIEAINRNATVTLADAKGEETVIFTRHIEAIITTPNSHTT